MDIFNEFHFLNPKISIDPDGVLPIYLKECACTLSPIIIHRLLLLSLQQNIFPKI